MNKSGAYDFGRLVPYMFIVLIVIAFIMLTMISTFNTYQVQTSMCMNELEKDLMVQELLYSPNCFVYVDSELERAYPGIIDLSKFTQDNLNSNCLDYIERNVRLTLDNLVLGNEVIQPEIVTKQVLVYNDGLFEMQTLIIEIEKSFDIGDCNV